MMDDGLIVEEHQVDGTRILFLFIWKDFLYPKSCFFSSIVLFRSISCSRSFFLLFTAIFLKVQMLLNLISSVCECSKLNSSHSKQCYVTSMLR